MSFTAFETYRLHLLLCYHPVPFDLHRASQKFSVNSMTRQNHKYTKEIRIIGFTPSWMWHFVVGLGVPEVSVKGSRFIFKGKEVQEKCQMWRNNPQVHRRKSFKFHIHNWSPRSNEHGSRVQCPYGCAHGCWLAIRASVLLNIVLITLRKCNRPSYNQSSWLLLNRFRRIFPKAEREIYAHFQRLLFLMDVVNWILLHNRSLKLQSCSLLVHCLIRRPGWL